MQHALALSGGFDCGPLFNLVKRRPPKRTKERGSHGKVRRAAEKRATPPWADAAATRAVFKRVKELQRETGVRHAADHIVPLNHPLVCGLHWHQNLAPVLYAENQLKSNSYWPDMWGEQPDLLTVALTPTSSSLQQSIPR